MQSWSWQLHQASCLKSDHVDCGLFARPCLKLKASCSRFQHVRPAPCRSLALVGECVQTMRVKSPCYVRSVKTLYWSRLQDPKRFMWREQVPPGWRSRFGLPRMGQQIVELQYTCGTEGCVGLACDGVDLNYVNRSRLNGHLRCGPASHEVSDHRSIDVCKLTFKLWSQSRWHSRPSA